jgi:lysophospholipase L1-like esterase
MQWYEDEVRQLIQRTGQNPVAASHPPVFYGSSSIRLWDTLAEDVGPGILNLGFGGSTLEACNYFFERIVLPVRPSSLLLYAGDNDLGDGRTVEQTFASFQSLAAKIAEPGAIPFGFIAVKPSPARFPIVDRIAKLNGLVRAAIEALPGGYFVDVFPAMLNGNGQPNASLYQPDGLHMSRAGYQLWSNILKPFRNKIFTA